MMAICQIGEKSKVWCPLGNKAGINLEGYFKLYAARKQIRSVYHESGQTIKIIAIDKREDLEVYRMAWKRILSMKSI
jgi:mRNA interferase RelE/StbE